MNYLANFLTGLSLASGFAAVIFSLEGRFASACWAIILSVIFDGLDGQAARRNPVPSEFGKQLDSLADVVSFGIAPSVLAYIFICRGFSLLAVAVLFVYLVCSVTRLAKYNIMPKDKLADYFYGLPTTVSGGILATVILISIKYTRLPSPFIFLPIILCLSFLMVSKIRYPDLDALKQILGRKVLFLFPAALIAFVFIPEITVFALFVSYLIFCSFFLKKFV
ncbi:MAG: CDP-diacylglycerol--serine O-phosphatidyltransferase [Candidatus Omnitrophota bacterium]